MNLPLLFSTAFIVGLSGAMMPGPVTAVLAEHTLKKGFKASPLITLGHLFTEVVMVLLLAVGLGSYMAREGVAGAIGISGGVVLAWMGYGMVKSALSGSLSLTAAEGKKVVDGSISAGVLTSISNPYWFLWWATVGAGYVTLSLEHGILGAMVFLSGHILADFAWLSLLAIALVTGKRFITDKVYNGAVVFLGAFLIVFAIYFLWSGVSFLI